MLVGASVAVSVRVGGGMVALGVELAGAEVDGMTCVVVPPAVQAANPRIAMIRLTDKELILINFLNIQLHFPDGFQQWPTLLET